MAASGEKSRYSRAAIFLLTTRLGTTCILKPGAGRGGSRADFFFNLI